ncbi:putative enzyme related to lactoylglutathione lyase [Kitasatospora sp. MAP12-15]|uniref:VOC family protein n=1 Tax=unclassified Kitasatospora TaxID=2633591 RepID=UPI0024744C2C|nr:VOC family protein [Kitasatospora sp. MAP12-44]MDH6112059.1 putative enzyme related to lactoylglutathione lyase [Kitasatospora sp. MAP12-44]
MSEVTAPYVPGTPCWIDLMVPDQQAALDFYRDLFGWQGEVGPEEFGGYSVCTLKGKPVAGIMKAMAMGDQPPPPPNWTSYFSSADADRTQAAVSANGGAVMAPAMDVAKLGRMLIAADPQGAVFGVWQPVEFPGAQIVNEPGALVWNQLNTSDVKAAGQFYQASLGLDAGPMPEMPEFTGFSVKGHLVGGLQSLENLPPGVPPHWLVNFAVDDTDSTVDALVKAGGNVIVPAFDMPKVGRMAVLQDPQGGTFGVVTLVPPAS